MLLAILLGKLFDRRPINFQCPGNLDEQLVVDDALSLESDNAIGTLGDVLIADKSSEIA
jgi:hypothetical protein